eukprot:9376685-Pyramimonas_sp.AAC.1
MYKSSQVTPLARGRAHIGREGKTSYSASRKRRACSLAEIQNVLRHICPGSVVLRGFLPRSNWVSGAHADFPTGGFGGAPLGPRSA